MLSFAQNVLILFGDADHAEFNDIMPAIAEMDANAKARCFRHVVGESLRQ
ncbi:MULTISPECIES: hypothetical protein [unclassified Devosia]|nr:MULTISPECIES: hypothetical protein [unclassified Devosia]MBN9305193.1 hypothetical protein [Devosia sp.]